MYASRAQREAEIEVGAGRPAGELRNWLADSAAQLAEDLPGSPNPRGSPPFRPGDGPALTLTASDTGAVRQVCVTRCGGEYASASTE